ncbi:MAG: helix-turn-helix transcriptional regulator [Bacteroidota bacterium]
MAKQQLKKSLILPAFGKRLRALRLKKGLTPAQFSKATGIDKDTLRKYEAGESEPKLVAIMTMAKALKISHLDLLPADIGS